MMMPINQLDGSRSKMLMWDTKQIEWSMRDFEVISGCFQSPMFGILFGKMSKAISQYYKSKYVHFRGNKHLDLVPYIVASAPFLPFFSSHGLINRASSFEYLAPISTLKWKVAKFYKWSIQRAVWPFWQYGLTAPANTLCSPWIQTNWIAHMIALHIAQFS